MAKYEEIELDFTVEEYEKILDLAKTKIPQKTHDDLLVEWMVVELLKIAMDDAKN